LEAAPIIREDGVDAIAHAEYLEDDGVIVFRTVCQMGLEGMVSKRLI
jgi:ATP-dependent DNA ligase